MTHRRLRIELSDRNLKRPRAARSTLAAIDRGVVRCRFQQFLVLDFPRPRSGRGVSCYGGRRPAWGACRTSAATCGPVRPESEALRRRARQTVPQSTEVFCPCRSQQFLVLGFPRPRSGRGVSCCGGVRAPRGACRTSAATCGPVRPESEALRRRAQHTGPQSTGASGTCFSRWSLRNRKVRNRKVKYRKAAYTK